MKKIVFTFGRMNPPTIGHEKLANKIKDVARKEKADARIYLSHTNKPNTDPLSYNDKIKFAKKAFGIAYKSNAKQIFQIAKELFGQGYTDVIMVVGSDRVDEFQTILNKYNDKGDYNFDSIKVVSAGQRDPDAKGVEGMSGTKLRNLARDGDQKTFMQGLASKLSPVDKKKVYALVAKNMTEELEIDEAVLNIQQRKARARLMKKLAPKMARARKMKAKRMADPNQLKVRAQKAAIAAVRKKVAGDKGVKYAELSPNDKMNVDKLVQKKSALIAKLAKKQLPKIRKAEQERLKALRGSTKTEQFNLTEEAENALRKKSKESGISYGILKKVFDRGMGAYKTNPGSVRPNVTSPQQWAFARVNSFIKGGKTRTTADADLWKQHSKNEEINEAWWNDLWSKLSQMIHPKGWKVALKTYVDGMKDKEHRDHPSKWAQDVALRYDVKGLDGRHLVQYINKLVAQGKLPKELKAEYVTEEGGAGEEGTKKLLSRYKKDTPNEAYNPDEDFDKKIDKKKLKEFYLPETAEYKGRKVKLNDPMRSSDGKKKFYVYVKNEKGNVIKLGFGDPNMEIKRDDPARRKSFRARHNCDNPGPKWKARYWSCYQWRGSAKVDN